MIIKSEDFREACKTISLAIDGSNDITLLSDTLKLYNADGFLHLDVTNREYYVSTKFAVEDNTPFVAAVNASTFLSLIARSTTQFVEMSCTDKNLVIKVDGTYYIPLIYVNEDLLDLPEITISNETVNMNVSADILNSILVYNTREITSNTTFLRPVQKMYYLDESGAITFTTGACVNSFTLEKPVKLLLSAKVVKLFKLFTSGDIKMIVGQDAVADSNTIATKVCLSDDKTKLTAILQCDDSLLAGVPVKAIRDLANKNYNYSVVFDTQLLVSALSRLLLFATASNYYGKLTFKTESVDIEMGENVETIKYCNESNITDPYIMQLDFNSFNGRLTGIKDEHITFNFGDNRSCTLVYSGIKNVVPEAIAVNNG